MIEVKVNVRKSGYTVISGGHTEHDVCVWVSSNINTLHQYVADQERLCNIKINSRQYEFGETYIDFEVVNQDKAPLVKEVVKAIMRGIELVQNNYPDEVNFWWGYD